MTENDKEEEEMVVVAKPVPSGSGEGDDDGGEDENPNKKQKVMEATMKKFKVEIEPGLFRRCYVTYQSNQDLYDKLIEACSGGGDKVKTFYYKDDAGHLTIIDGPNDIAGLLDVFQDHQVVTQLRLFKQKSSDDEVEDDQDDDEDDDDDDDEESNPIRPSDLIKVLCENEHVCLDIGSDCVREVPANVVSKTTLLRIKRLDGPSKGLVKTNHSIGFFSKDSRFRLDVGSAAVRRECPASHDSWATLLHIRRHDDDNNNNTPLQYNELVGVFSHENNKRLDLGPNSMKMPCMASHSSWATRLKISIKEKRNNLNNNSNNVFGDDSDDSD